MFMKLAANQKQSGLNGLRRNLKKKKKSLFDVLGEFRGYTWLSVR